jgi:hypothetical protein
MGDRSIPCPGAEPCVRPGIAPGHQQQVAYRWLAAGQHHPCAATRRERAMSSTGRMGMTR